MCVYVFVYGCCCYFFSFPICARSLFISCVYLSFIFVCIFFLFFFFCLVHRSSFIFLSKSFLCRFNQYIIIIRCSGNKVISKYVGANVLAKKQKNSKKKKSAFPWNAYPLWVFFRFLLEQCCLFSKHRINVDILVRIGWKCLIPNILFSNERKHWPDETCWKLIDELADLAYWYNHNLAKML